MLTIAGNSGPFRIFDVGVGGRAVNISGLTITGGNAANGAGIRDTASTLTLTDVVLSNNSTSGYGGGVAVTGLGAVTLTNCTLTANSAGDGGGVYSTSEGTVNLLNCTISGNTAGGGGAVDANTGSILTIANCSITGNSQSVFGAISVAGEGAIVTISGSTIANNSALYRWGRFCQSWTYLTVSNSDISQNTGVYAGGGIYFSGDGPINIFDTTLSGNTSTGPGGAIDLVSFSGTLAVNANTIVGNLVAPYNVSNGGGGITVYSGSGGTIRLDNTIVSGNSTPLGENDIYAGAGTSVTSSYDAIGTAVGFQYVPGPGDLPVGANSNLQPLRSNGGPTQTVAFAAGSPLLNTGDPALADTTDQRGISRSIGGRPDIGAYEYQPITVAGVRVNDGSAQRSEVRSITVTLSGPVSFAGGNAAAAFQLNHVQTGTDVTLSAAVSTNATGQTSVTLTFSGRDRSGQRPQRRHCPWPTAGFS